MNCKPGDLAVVVSSMNGGNVGKVVTVIRLATTAEIATEMPGAIYLGAIWRTDKPLEWGNKRGERCDAYLAPDVRLRPIRDNDGEDETLTWAGKPEQITTAEEAA
jgi:hypothetical protein